MINENKLNYIVDLLQEDYVFDKILTTALSKNTDFIGAIANDSLAIKSIRYLRENFVQDNNILLAIGWQEEGNIRTYGVFIKDISKGK